MSRSKPITFTSIPGVSFEFVPRLFGKPQLWADGQRLPKKRNVYRLDSAGRTYEIKTRTGLDFMAPALQVGHEVVHPVRPLPTGLVVVALLPLVLLAGGALGGAIGGLAAVTNLTIMRSERNLALRVLIVLAILGIAVGAYVGLAAVLTD